MASFGYTLSSEEHAPTELVRSCRRAEELAFDFVSISDHSHPWIGAQGHSPFVWSVLGALAATTERIELGVGVTCPTIRVHPAIVAQATATTSLLCEGRFVFGVGTGEALNEHVLGHRWPPANVRLQMLEEAIGVIRALWSGDTVDHDGHFYRVENARLYDPPAQPPPIVVSAFGPNAVDLAARVGDGYWGTSPDSELVGRYRQQGGTGRRYAQIDVCWAEDAADARKTVHQVWPNGGFAGQLAQDLPTPTHFEELASMVREEDATASTPCGPDLEPFVEAVRTYLDAGYDHLYFHQIGPGQDGFLRFWTEQLEPALAGLRDAGAPGQG